MASPSVELVTDAPDEVYHNLSRETDRKTVRENGLKAAHTSYARDAEEQILDEVAGLYNLDYPVNRREAVYCWPNAEYVNKLAPTDDEGDLGGLVNDYTGIIIDITQIDHPMFIADMSAMTNLITEWHKPNSITIPDTPPTTLVEYPGIRAARDYLHTITPVESYSDIQSASADLSWPELIIEGDVPATSITGTYP